MFVIKLAIDFMCVWKCLHLCVWVFCFVLSRDWFLLHSDKSDLSVICVFIKEEFGADSSKSPLRNGEFY